MIPLSSYKKSIKMAAAFLIWFRHDLRLADHPALTEAAKQGVILPVYILDDVAAGVWRMGGASRWWLHHGLSELEKDFARHGIDLILRRGDSETVLRSLLHETGAKGVYWNRRYQPYAVRQDSAIKAALKRDGFDVKSFNGSLLFEPWDIKNGTGGPYKVFTPFWKACRKFLTDYPLEEVLPIPRMKSIGERISSDDLSAWNLLPMKPDWASGLRDFWKPGEAGGRERLKDFLEAPIAHYKTARDFPSVDATSRLSPYLAFGHLSPRQIALATKDAIERGNFAPGALQQAEHFMTEIGWREFAYHIMTHFPQTPERALNKRFDDFPWRNDPDALRAWQRGMTGYPIVDAGMRQLWRTGWMHNRVRMIVGSFLTKHLLLPWQEGARWFWDTLADADLANNTMGWQWVSGCGADAAPYFRIFNPVSQSETFDSNGDYIRHYVPELRKLPNEYLHAPWTAPESVLGEAGVVLGEHYPKPLVDHRFARDRALNSYKKIT